MLRSPPSRRRGLKFFYSEKEAKNYIVASFAEAWIEISWEKSEQGNEERSPPSRRRGLKSFISSGCPYLPIVASFAEAWIEIGTTYKLSPLMQVASFAEAWIEIGKKT